MARGMPLGLMPGMRYEEGEASLREGDSVLFYSDGLAEAHDPKGEMFSCTPSLERDGSRRTTSPFLRSSILRPDAEPPRTAATKLSAKLRRRPLCSLADHRNGTFSPDFSLRPILASVYRPNPRSERLLVPLFRGSPSPTFGEAGISRCASLKRSDIVVPITREQTGRRDDIFALHHW